MDDILEKIHKSALRFLSPLNPEETYKAIAEEAIKLVGGAHASILIAQNNVLHRVYSTNPLLEHVSSSNKGFRYQVFQTRKPLVLRSDEVNILKARYPELEKLKTNSIILLPLFYKNDSMGVLSVVSGEETDFTKKELDVLTVFASLASLAIRKTQLYDETRLALEQRDLFMSMAAHELRTPLTTLSGYIDLMYRKRSNEESNEARWIKEMYREANRLKNLINEFLQANVIKKGDLHFALEECHVAKIIEEVVENFEVLHPDRAIKFENNVSQKDDLVVGDPDKLTQVFVNIIENSFKYSPRDSEVVINTKIRGSDVVIQIKDSGKGIDKKDLPKVFEGFFRGEDSKTEGMGLGLYLAKNIIDKHHGDIIVRSKVNKGTQTTILLPNIKR